MFDLKKIKKIILGENFKDVIGIHKNKVQAVFKLKTCESVPTLAINNKMFHRGVKSSCCDVLLLKEEVTGFRGSLMKLK